MTPDTNKERAEFEAWLDPAWSRDTFADDDGDTLYVEDWVQGAWMMFCHNRASLAAKAPAAEPVACVYQAALDIRTAQGCQLGGEKCPVLYTDTINGQQVRRDDLWLCSTAAFTAPPAPTEQWTLAKDQLPPCRDDQLYIGVNSAGFAGVFNAVADIAGDVHCMYETAEEVIDVLSGLQQWRVFTYPAPPQGAAKGDGNG